MGQERLNHLAMISIENKIAADLYIEDMALMHFRTTTTTTTPFFFIANYERSLFKTKKIGIYFVF